MRFRWPRLKIEMHGPGLGFLLNSIWGIWPCEQCGVWLDAHLSDWHTCYPQEDAP